MTSRPPAPPHRPGRTIKGLGSSTIKPLIDNLGSLAPGAARDTLNSMLMQLQSSQGKAGLALITGIAVARLHTGAHYPTDVAAGVSSA
ncbi:phosphatase PAP2 family protein [Streptomyces sp. KLMMK]|uniref:phosphatase PAP2 family protein n=1 Tax=Streptomyces sp. KLMMK TaxID=3109353 RepID=UPI0030006F52